MSRLIVHLLWVVAILAPGGVLLLPALVVGTRKARDAKQRTPSDAPAKP